MACNCHGKKGLSVVRTSPFSQCTVCAKKHVVKAWNLFHEFTYTADNRDTISGQLRLAADHLMYDHRDTALLARDLAVMIEENRDADIITEWDDLLHAVRLAFAADHPEAVMRLMRAIDVFGNKNGEK